MSKKRNHNSQKYRPEDAPIIYEDDLNAKKSAVVSTNVADSSGENVNIGEKKASKGVRDKLQKPAKENVVNNEVDQEPKINSCTFSEDFLNKTLVTVRIIGDKSGRNGVHSMCIANIAKVVVTNNDIDRVILVTQKTAEAIYDLIVDYPEKIGISEMNKEARVNIAEKFWANLRRYKAIN